MRKDYHSKGYDKQTDEEMLKMCQKGWRSDETPCGTGSERANADKAVDAIRNVVEEFDIRSIADAGAGDLNWIELYLHAQYVAEERKRRGGWTGPGVSYHAFDLVPRNNWVTEFDITKEIIPGEPDLIICRHVLNHLSIQKAMYALSNFRQSGAQYLLMTTCGNQEAYWKEYYFEPFAAAPLRIYQDCQHWWLELHDLRTLR